MQHQAIHTYVRVGEHVMKSMPMGIFTVTSPLRWRRRHDDVGMTTSPLIVAKSWFVSRWNTQLDVTASMTTLPWRRCHDDVAMTTSPLHWCFCRPLDISHAVAPKVHLSVPTVIKCKPGCLKCKPGCQKCKPGWSFQNASSAYSMFSFKTRNECHLKLFYQVILLLCFTIDMSNTLEMMYLHQSTLDKV